MKKLVKKALVLMLAASMTAGIGVTAFAEEVTVGEGDKPYIALGADLSADQKATVLDLLGVSDEYLEHCDVVTITNEQEHKYLDSYIDSSVIGTRALSSVLVMEGEKGSGINVTTKNISYCTAGMYENALATAGLEDAQVIVVGPTSISGTSALIGAIEAYSVMSGKKIDADIIDGAIDEIVTTGMIEEALENSTPEEVEGMIAYLKDELKNSKGLSDAELEQKIRDAATEFGVVLDDSEVAEILSLLKKLMNLNLDWDKLGDQALKLYDTLKNGGVDIDGIVNKLNGFSGSTSGQGGFAKLISFFKSIFKK